MAEFQAGSLVRVRGREWVVLGRPSDQLLHVRPIGGLDEEATVVFKDLEGVEAAHFEPPGLEDLGDFAACRLLRDAATLSTRASAGPFRSFGRIAVEPRPYQLVPLLMALKLDPVRLLIADDVGIGKTIEACLILKELLDRSEIKAFSVLCPPHLAEQWKMELESKFHIDATLVLADTIRKLERRLPTGVSVFDRHPYTVVSTDLIKGRSRRDDFIAKCPRFLIVDEAHGCAPANAGGNHQRYALVRQLTEDPDRHVVLVTATPHSGNEGAFRSLLGLLDRAFLDLPLDLEKEIRDDVRTRLAKHLVQRRRADIRKYLEEDTSFPVRRSRDLSYAFSQDFRALFDDVLEYARDYVNVAEQGKLQGMARYWAALGLLRCLGSSPAAAMATLRNRMALAEQAPETLEAMGRQAVLDEEDVEDAAELDVELPGTMDEDDAGLRQRQKELIRRLQGFLGAKDVKLHGMVKELKALLRDGRQPIVFCRFVHTAEYLVEQFREAGLGRGVEVEGVTGLLPGAEREARIARLVKNERYVLVATNCLSEGINLQEEFDTVIHYDLSWNPTVHEQREGRVDRFGQPRDEVFVVTYYGENNPIDGAVLQVLLRKHAQIKNDLGVSVSIPGNSDAMTKTIFENLLFRGRRQPEQLMLDLASEPEVLDRQQAWEDRSRLEKESRTRFAQRTLSPELVAQELQEVRAAIGHQNMVKDFVHMAIKRFGGHIYAEAGTTILHIDQETPRALRQALGSEGPIRGRFALPLEKDETYLGRTGDIVEGLSTHVLDHALSAAGRNGRANLAARLGMTRTQGVSAPTTLLLLRQRYQLYLRHGEAPVLAEEILLRAFQGLVSDPEWLDAESSEGLLDVLPSGNLPEAVMEDQKRRLVDAAHALQGPLEPLIEERARHLLDAHQRVRQAQRVQRKVDIHAVRPTDILGIYRLLPA